MTDWRMIAKPLISRDGTALISLIEMLVECPWTHEQAVSLN
jgi:hypothetical protein